MMIALDPWDFKRILCENHNCIPITKSDIDKLVLGAHCGTIKMKNLVNVDVLKLVEIITSDEYDAYIKTLRELRYIMSDECIDSDDYCLSDMVLKECHPELNYGVTYMNKQEEEKSVWVKPNSDCCADPDCLGAFIFDNK